MNTYALLAGALFLYMTAWFFVSLVMKKNDIADVAWGIGFMMMSWISYRITGASDPNSLIVTILVSIWGIRLSYHIWKRNRGKPEDYRYAAWRKEWGRTFFIRSYLQVYLLQGFFLYVILFPVLFIHANGNQSFSVSGSLGLIVWISGFLFESVADRQLAQFKKLPENKGKILMDGLWRYSRHPNYFGEVVQWWGIFLFTLSIPGGVFTVIGPAMITWLILYVSGVPLLEKKYASREDFREYARRTSVFLPLPPRK